jgi:hypothetical protein
MRRDIARVSAARAAAIVAACAALAACSSVERALNLNPESPPANAAAAANTPAGAAAATDAAVNPSDIPCPDVTVRNGAATLIIRKTPSAAGEPNAMDVRYQGTIVRLARDCTPRAGLMTVKVGIEGRVITGPAGGPGEVDVPLRLAVVQEGPNPKTVLSKLVHIPVSVTPDNGTVTFTHVDPDVAFPMPKPIGDLSSYVIYVGFDPNAAQPQRAKPRPRRKG